MSVNVRGPTKRLDCVLHHRQRRKHSSECHGPPPSRLPGPPSPSTPSRAHVQTTDVVDLVTSFLAVAPKPLSGASPDTVRDLIRQAFRKPSSDMTPIPETPEIAATTTAVRRRAAECDSSISSSLRGAFGDLAIRDRSIASQGDHHELSQGMSDSIARMSNSRASALDRSAACDRLRQQYFRLLQMCKMQPSLWRQVVMETGRLLSSALPAATQSGIAVDPDTNTTDENIDTTIVRLCITLMRSEHYSRSNEGKKKPAGSEGKTEPIVPAAAYGVGAAGIAAPLAAASAASTTATAMDKNAKAVVYETSSDTCVVGRSPLCDMQIVDVAQTESRAHAIIAVQRKQGLIAIIDIGSLAGIETLERQHASLHPRISSRPYDRKVIWIEIGERAVFQLCMFVMIVESTAWKPHT